MFVGCVLVAPRQLRFCDLGMQWVTMTKPQIPPAVEVTRGWCQRLMDVETLMQEWITRFVTATLASTNSI